MGMFENKNNSCSAEYGTKKQCTKNCETNCHDTKDNCPTNAPQKKTIFEGFVNGKKFSTVESYNRAVEAAIETGFCDAHTHTFSQRNAIAGTEAKSQKIRNLLIGFETGLSTDCLRKLVKKETDNSATGYESWSLDELWDFAIEDGIKNMSTDELNQFRKEVQKIFEYIIDNTDESVTKRNALKYKIDCLQSAITELDDQLEKWDYYQDMYNDFLDAIEDRIGKLSDDYSRSTKPKTENDDKGQVKCDPETKNFDTKGQNVYEKLLKALHTELVTLADLLKRS